MLANQTVEHNRDYVQSSYPSTIDNITYGEAIDAYCTDVSWKQFESEGVEDLVVQVEGKCNYEGKQSDIIIQFSIPQSWKNLNNGEVLGDTPICLTFLGLDDAESTEEQVMKNIMFEMFTTYASNHGIELDESQKEGVLVTQKYLEETNTESEDGVDEEVGADGL